MRGAHRNLEPLGTRFFDARKMMKQMAGQFGFGGGGTRKGSKNRKGK